MHYTFSGFNFPPTFLDLLLEVGVDRIMFSADYPYGSMTEARAFLDQLAGERRRQGADRPRQCGEAVRIVIIRLRESGGIDPQRSSRWLSICGATNAEALTLGPELGGGKNCQAEVLISVGSRNT